PHSPLAAVDSPWAATFVGGVWGLLTLAALGFIRAYGSKVPYYDEWTFVPILTGEEPATLTWLWSQFEEHRIPFFKCFYLALFTLGGGDLRVGMVFNVLLVSALALAMILAARRLRGWVNYADAFFPLALLSWGAADSFFLWGMIFQLVSSTMLAGIWLILLVG